MKLATTQSNVKAGNLKESHGFVVANNAHMMKILSDSLYNNKVQSVIRELSTNSYDTHVEAGCPHKPFDVIIPANYGDYFTIRDYGTGLSKDALVELYRVYGRSNKTHSDELTGCLGLGSKSPFCYTDTFIAVSYHNGEKITVINTKDAAGRPTLNIASIEKTDEPNGLEISFQCDTDVYLFTSEAKTVYKYFKTPPNIVTTDGHTVEITPPKYTLEGTGWGYNETGRSYAIMGQVRYRIESNEIDNVKLLNRGFDLYFDMGAIEFNAGRESLQYTAKTKNAIKAKLLEIEDDIKDHFDSLAKNCKSLWEARAVYNTITEEHWYLSREINYTLTFDKFKVDWSRHSAHKNVHFFNYNPGEDKGSHSKKNNTFYSNNKYKFFVFDGTSWAYERCRKYAQDNQCRVVLVKKSTEGLSRQYLTDFVGILDSEIGDLSKLPKPVINRKSQAKTTKDSVRAARLVDNTSAYYYNNKDRWHGSEKIVLDDEVGYYAPTAKYEIADKYTPLHCLQAFCSFHNVNFIGVPNNVKKKVEDHKNWTHIKELVKEKADELKKDSNYGIWNTIQKSDLNETSIKQLILIKTTNKEFELCKVELQNYLDFSKKLSKTTGLIHEYGFLVDPPKATSKYLEFRKKNKLMKTLESVLTSYPDRDDIDNITDYINSL